jgi:hypothetical protein
VASYALPRFFTTGCFLPLPFSVLSAVSQWMVACPIPPCSQSQGMGFSCRARPPVVRHWDLLQQMPAMLLSCYVSAQLSRFCEILAIEGSSNCNKRSLLEWSSTHCTQTKLITLLLRNVANSIISCDSSCLGGHAVGNFMCIIINSIFRVPRPKRAVTRHRNAEASLEKSTASSAASCFETFLRSKFQRRSCAVFPPFRFPRHVAGKLYGCYPLIAMLVTMNHTF